MPSPFRRSAVSSMFFGNSSVSVDDDVDLQMGYGRSSATPSSVDKGYSTIATRLSESCWVSDDEGTRRTPAKGSPFRSISFSVGTTPLKTFPTRFVCGLAILLLGYRKFCVQVISAVFEHWVLPLSIHWYVRLVLRSAVGVPMRALTFASVSVVRFPSLYLYGFCHGRVFWLSVPFLEVSTV